MSRNEHFEAAAGTGMRRPKDPAMQAYVEGTLRGALYPGEELPTLYHGSPRADLAVGEHLEPGRPGNFVRRMKHVYATEDVEAARRYAHGDRGHVYQVEPTGPVGHRRDARAVNKEWASEFPLRVVRKMAP